MSFFAVLFALVIEQFKPLPRDNWVHQLLVGWVRWTGRNFDAGEVHHAKVVWAVSVLVPGLLATGLYLGIDQLSVLLALLFDVCVLYFSLGFRQFSHYYTDIRDALERGDEDEARRLLAEWRQLDASDLPRNRAAAPCARACAAGCASPCFRCVLLVRAHLHPRSRATGRGGVPHGRVRGPVTGRIPARPWVHRPTSG